MCKLIGYSDLEFPRRQVRRFSTSGTPYLRLEPYGMPRVPEQILNCAFYLYPSVADAKVGKNFGGTGFFVFFPTTDGSEASNTTGWVYAVTNWHVAVRDGASVMRINKLNGETDILDYGPEDWHFDPRFDIAVIPLPGILKEDVHKFSFIPTRIFCSKFAAKNENIGPGDDVFMAGRFIDHDGGQTNQPALRFGHISINPTPMRQGPIPSYQPSYCVDVHSRTGYSGSPAFIYRTVASDLSDIVPGGPGKDILVSGTRYFGLLGIHFARFPEIWELGKKQPTAEENLIAGQSAEYVKGMSGMTCVLPAWTIGEVLNMPKLKSDRSGKELNFTFGHHTNRLPDSSVPSTESAIPTTDENPDHKADFDRLLQKAAKVTKDK